MVVPVDDISWEGGVTENFVGGPLLVELVSSTGSTVSAMKKLLLLYIHKLMRANLCLYCLPIGFVWGIWHIWDKKRCLILLDL